MSDTITLLISSAGRRVALLECFRKDAADLGIKLRILAIDVEPDLSAACASADAAFRAPRCTTPEFIPFVQGLVAREGIDLVVPTIDTELSAFAQTAGALRKLGATVNIASEQTVEIARNKQLTALTLGGSGIGVPRTCLLSSYLEEPSPWRGTQLVKPISGSSSIGIRRISSPADLEALAGEADRYVLQDFWEGSEYTVNVFYDASGALRCVIPHRRIEVRAGEVSKGRTERVPALLDIAERMAAALPPCRGAMCFQAIVTPGGETAVIEINARFGGGYPLAHAAGATFSRWLLEEAAGLPTSADNRWREQVTMLRYDAAVFV